MRCLTRRDFLASSLSAGAIALAPFAASGAETPVEPIIDIHQHTNYRERTSAQLVAHQRAMGATARPTL